MKYIQVGGGEGMSIKDLKKYRNEYNRDVRPWEVIISDFMDEVIITLEDFYKELAQNNNSIDVNNIKEVRNLANNNR